MSGFTTLDLVRQNYSKEVEDGVNKQIGLELKAFYTYLSLSYYYDRADVALPNFAKYFKKCADEEYEHAQKFMQHQNNRGGKIVLAPIVKPARDEWGTGVEGMQAALALEREVNQALLDLHAISDSKNDYQTSDYIEGHFLHEQVDAIKELTGHICNLNRVGVKGLGEYQFERQTL